MQPDLRLPTGKPYLRTFVTQTFEPALHKQSNSFSFIPGTGRNSLLSYLSAYAKNVGEDLKIDLKNLIWLRIDSDDQTAVYKTWQRQLRQQLEAVDTSKFGDLTELLDFLVNERRHRILLCVWVDKPVDQSFWESLRQINPMLIDWQFGFPGEVSEDVIKQLLGSLAQFALQNQWVMPLYMPEDIQEVIQNQVDLGFASLSKSQVNQVVQLSGGYPKLARYLIRHPEALTVDSWQIPEVKLMFEQVWDCLLPDSQRWLFSLVNNAQLHDGPGKFIQQTGLAKEDSAGWQLFSTMFAEYVAWLCKTLPPAISQQDGRLYLNQQPLDTVLSSQELLVFKLLWQAGDQITDRDTIAEVLWGAGWEDKYSDWAIDQVISRVRRKLSDRSPDGLIKTIKGQGFVIANHE